MAELSKNAKLVVKIITEQLNCQESQVVPEAKFIEDLGADSLDTIELVMALESAFNTTLIYSFYNYAKKIITDESNT